MATKVLVAGDVEGRVSQLFARVTTVNANHGPFHCVFCVGDFFGSGDGIEEALAPYRSGEAKAPLRTYVLGPGPSPPESVRALLGEMTDTDADKELAPDIIELSIELSTQLELGRATALPNLS